ncbi:unnamed protein product [Lactuca saligna]|uniref:FH2 domain-containing protein n=1 Tax=Lactuca saligna TaxID=75948 RepID=A0AA35VUQ4_LACSI|nr:unnamed protein product [Lactuca saligna]
MLDTYHAFQLFDEMLIQLKSSAEEMQAIIKGLEKTSNQFISIVELEVGSVTNLYSVVGRNVDALALYFGEDPARCPFEQVNSLRIFKTILQE